MSAFLMSSRLLVSLGASLAALTYQVYCYSFVAFLDNQETTNYEPLHDTDTYTYTNAAKRDFITSLPGLEIQTFRQFSGMFVVDEVNDRQIHYWFVESQDDPVNDPVIFWSNGGPGCSGLLGFGTEHGPFHYSKDGTLTPNDFSWNTAANMLYVEQPAGVGFSYSSTKQDYTTGDEQSALDNVAVLVEFFKRFPHLESNDLVISSESYGGHYIPQLALKLLAHEKFKHNFKSFLVGNPYVDPATNLITKFEAFYSHGLVAKPLYQNFIQSCVTPGVLSQKNCTIAQTAIYSEMGRGINPYALDYPRCTEVTTSSTQHRLDRYRSPSSQGLRLLSIGQNGPPFLPPEDSYRPCEERHFTAYLNRDDVKEALHVRKDLDWSACSDDIDYAFEDFTAPQTFLYKKIVSMGLEGKHNLRMLIYSGDDDSICSLAGTQAWIYDLGVDPEEGALWQPWFFDSQTAGYTTKFDMGKNSNASFVLATVHGAGHEVPTYRPKESLSLLRRFLAQSL